ncbi:MAG: helix-turn-helix domain-containing protein [Bacteroidota bacterium]
MTSADREKLKSQRKKGQLKVSTYKRIVGLLELDAGLTYEACSKVSDLSSRSLQNLAKRYEIEGLGCLIDLPRPGRPIKITPEQRDQITLLACEESPDGYSQCSLRLLAGKIVELGYCESISHTQVGNVLKKKRSNLI